MNKIPNNKAKKWPTQERKMWENKAKQMNYEGKRINKSIKKHKAFMKVSIFTVSCDKDGIEELIENADNWSYSHRCGEFVSDNQRQKMINNAFWKLCDTPKTDKVTQERHKAWMEMTKQQNEALINFKKP